MHWRIGVYKRSKHGEINDIFKTSGRYAAGTINPSRLTLNPNTIRYDTRCYFNVRSKADISQLNLAHGTDN